MAVGPPPPVGREAPKRDAAYYRALGEEQLELAKRLIEIAGEIQNAGEIIAESENDA